MNRHLRRRVLMALLAILSLAILGSAVNGCGFDFNLNCGETSAESKTYTDASYGYSFQYPGDWEIQEGDSAEVTGGSDSEGGVSVFDPDGTVADDYYIDLFQVSVYELNVTVDESMMPEIKSEVEGLLAELEEQNSDWQKVEDLTSAGVGEMDGYRTTYSFPMDDTPTMSTFYFVFSGNLQYQLTLQASTENWEEKQAEFDAIVASFQPGVTE